MSIEDLKEIGKQKRTARANAAGGVRVNMLENEPPKIEVYDRIGGAWWEGEYSSSYMAAQLKEFGDKEIDVHLNTRGGDIHHGTHMFNSLADYPGKVNMILHNVYSMGSALSQAGTTIKMYSTGTFHMHLPFTDAPAGDRISIEAKLDFIKQQEASILPAYTMRSGLDEKTVVELMEKNTTMTAEQALAYGFIDEIIEPDPTNQASAFMSYPDEDYLASLKEEDETPPATELPVTQMSDEPQDSFTRQEAVEIVSMCMSENKPELAIKAIEENWPINMAREMIKQVRAQGSTNTPIHSGHSSGTQPGSKEAQGWDLED